MTAAGDRSYVVRRASHTVPLVGQVDDTEWAGADALRVDEYPWFESGERFDTEARLLWDDERIYVQFRCEDRHIFAQYAELNSHVCRDSCVEFFANPRPGRGDSYFNLEMNCCGVMLMQWGPSGSNRTPITPRQAAAVQVVGSEGPPPREERPTDAHWWVAAALPFDVVAQMSGGDIRPRAGDSWRGNFYRCGGKSNKQYACWNPIDLPGPNFHVPQFFGEIRFA